MQFNIMSGHSEAFVAQFRFGYAQTVDMPRRPTGRAEPT